MNKVFESFMSCQLNQFSAYRKQLGYEPDGIRSVLRDFDRYLQKNAVDQSQLTPEFFLKLRVSIHEDPNTVNRVLSGLRAELIGDRLQLTGSDLDLTIIVSVTVAGQEDGTVVIG